MQNEEQFCPKTSLNETIGRAKAVQEVINMLRTLEYKDEDSLDKMDKDYLGITDGTSLDKNVLANCLDSLEAWGYTSETTLYEIEYDLLMLKERIERFKEDNGINPNTINLNEFEITTKFN